MLVSVIIPNYNHAPYLKQRIDSVLNQTFGDYELIILDDCSTDDSREIIEQYRNNPKVSHIKYNEKNSGSPFRQWERGIELAKGNYVWIAESDDFAEASFLEELTQKIVTEDVGIAYCQSWDVNFNNSKGSTREYWTKEFKKNIWEKDFIKKGIELLPFLKVKNIIPNVSACLIKKEKLINSFKKAPKISSFKLCGDWFLWLLFFQQDNIQIAFSSKPLNYFRETGTSTRYFETLEKKQLRVLEEVETMQTNIHLFNANEYRLKIESWKKKWFAIHNKSNFNSSFFKISKILKIKQILFFYQFIKFKWQRE